MARINRSESAPARRRALGERKRGSSTNRQVPRAQASARRLRRRRNAVRIRTGARPRRARPREASRGEPCSNQYLRMPSTERSGAEPPWTRKRGSNTNWVAAAWRGCACRDASGALRVSGASGARAPAPFLSRPENAVRIRTGLRPRWRACRRLLPRVARLAPARSFSRPENAVRIRTAVAVAEVGARMSGLTLRATPVFCRRSGCLGSGCNGGGVRLGFALSGR